MNVIPACMGGFCTQRDRCVNHIAPNAMRENPAERICPKGLEVIEWVPRPIQEPETA